MRARLSLLISPVALAAALAACGGDGVGKPEFVAKADAACAQSNSTVAAVGKPSNLPELATAAGTIATAVDSQVDALRELEAPKDDRPVIGGVIGSLADMSAPARALQDAAAKSDDAGTARAANDLKAKADAAAAQAGSYGLNSCGRGLQAPVTTVFEGGRDVLKAAFVARADGLCTAATRRVANLAEPTSLASAVRFLTTYIPIEERLFADIKALVVPPGDESVVAEMLAAQDQVIARDKELLAAAQQRNERLFDRLYEDGVPLTTAANAKFDAYGLRTCGTLSAF